MATIFLRPVCYSKATHRQRDQKFSHCIGMMQKNYNCFKDVRLMQLFIRAMIENMLTTQPIYYFRPYHHKWISLHAEDYNSETDPTMVKACQRAERTPWSIILARKSNRRSTTLLPWKHFLTFTMGYTE